MQGEKFMYWVFRSCFICNSYKFTCQEQTENPPVLTFLQLLILTAVLRTLS